MTKLSKTYPNLANNHNLKNLFGQAIFRLTALYALILLFVSLVFSISFYQVSIRELDSNLRSQARTLGEKRFLVDKATQESILDNLKETNIESKERVFNRLIVGNIVMLGGSIFLSYAFARKTLEPISEAHEAQSRFTSDASHELRTPLAVMQTEIDVALRDPNLTKLEAIELLNSVREEVLQMSKLTTNLLSLSHQTKPEDLELKKLNAYKLVKDSLNKYEEAAKVKSVDIVVDVPKTTNVLADATVLKELVGILLENAIKFTPQNSTVTVQAAKKGKCIILCVRDQGNGVAKANQDKIFERFFRQDDSRHEEGFGLGLSIAKLLASSIDADLYYKEPQDGAGAMLCIKLPAAN